MHITPVYDPRHDIKDRIVFTAHIICIRKYIIHGDQRVDLWVGGNNYRVR